MFLRRICACILLDEVSHAARVKKWVQCRPGEAAATATATSATALATEVAAAASTAVEAAPDFAALTLLVLESVQLSQMPVFLYSTKASANSVEWGRSTDTPAAEASRALCKSIYAARDSPSSLVLTRVLVWTALKASGWMIPCVVVCSDTAGSG